MEPSHTASSATRLSGRSSSADASAAVPELADSLTLEQRNQTVAEIIHATNGGAWGLGTDEKRFYQALENALQGIKPGQRGAAISAIAVEYSQFFGGHRSLVSDVEGEFSCTEKARARALLQGNLNESYALGIDAAFSRLTTSHFPIFQDEKEVLRILEQCNDRTLLARRYQELHHHGNSSLRDALIENLSGDRLKHALALLDGKDNAADKSGKAQTDPVVQLAYDFRQAVHEGASKEVLLDKATKLADACHEAVSGMGTDEAALYKILGGPCDNTKQFMLKWVNYAYKEKYKSELVDDLKSDLGGRDRKTLLYDLNNLDQDLRTPQNAIAYQIQKLQTFIRFERGGDGRTDGWLSSAVFGLGSDFGFEHKGHALNEAVDSLDDTWRALADKEQFSEKDRETLQTAVARVQVQLDSYIGGEEAVTQMAATTAAVVASAATLGLGAPSLAAALTATRIGGAVVMGAVVNTSTTIVADRGTYDLDNIGQDLGRGAIIGGSTVLGAGVEFGLAGNSLVHVAAGAATGGADAGLQTLVTPETWDHGTYDGIGEVLGNAGEGAVTGGVVGGFAGGIYSRVTREARTGIPRRDDLRLPGARDYRTAGDAAGRGVAPDPDAADAPRGGPRRTRLEEDRDIGEDRGAVVDDGRADEYPDLPLRTPAAAAPAPEGGTAPATGRRTVRRGGGAATEPGAPATPVDPAPATGRRTVRRGGGAATEPGAPATPVDPAPAADLPEGKTETEPAAAAPRRRVVRRGSAGGSSETRTTPPAAEPATPGEPPKDDEKI